MSEPAGVPSGAFHLEARARRGPILTRHHRGSGVNARLGLRITTAVGTMWCAYAFAGLALVSLPAAVSAMLRGDTVTGIAWLSQAFLQLVLLPVIIVGQQIQARASDERAVQTFRDTELIVDRLDVRSAGGIAVLLAELHALRDELARR